MGTAAAARTWADQSATGLAALIISKTMSLDLIAAIGKRIERELFASHTKTKSTSASSAQSAAAAIPFMLPTSTPGIDLVPTTAPVAITDVSVGDTFRRKGMLSDVPMTVSRTENGSVYASFSDGSVSQEMAFDANDIDIVSKTSSIPALPQTPYVTNLIDSVRTIMPLAATPVTLNESSAASSTTESAIAALTPSAPTVVMADSATSNAIATTSTAAAASIATTASSASTTSASTTSASTTSASTTASATTAATSKAADTTVPDGAIRLPDGTLQFGYAPTGGVSHAPAVQTPVPAEFGVGATFRREGVADVPMTVTNVGDGVITANFTFPDGTSRQMAFVPDQLDLVTHAPGT